MRQQNYLQLLIWGNSQNIIEHNQCKKINWQKKIKLNQNLLETVIGNNSKWALQKDLENCKSWENKIVAESMSELKKIAKIDDYKYQKTKK